MKYLFIELEVRDGEREHTHRVLHTTNAKSIHFAAERYAATYWGYGKRDGDGWYHHGGEIYTEYKKVKELTKEQFEQINALFS
jgi:hypothetical protein